MNHWFVIHDLLAYSQHKDMIGNIVKANGVKQPKFSLFGDMKEELVKRIKEPWKI